MKKEKEKSSKSVILYSVARFASKMTLVVNYPSCCPVNLLIDQSINHLILAAVATMFI